MSKNQNAKKRIEMSKIIEMSKNQNAKKRIEMSKNQCAQREMSKKKQQKAKRELIKHTKKCLEFRPCHAPIGVSVCVALITAAAWSYYNANCMSCDLSPCATQPTLPFHHSSPAIVRWLQYTTKKNWVEYNHWTGCIEAIFTAHAVRVVH